MMHRYSVLVIHAQYMYKLEFEASSLLLIEVIC